MNKKLSFIFNNFFNYGKRPKKSKLFKEDNALNNISKYPKSDEEKDEMEVKEKNLKIKNT